MQLNNGKIVGQLIAVHKNCGKELAGTFFVRLIYFISWPYMVIVFQQDYGLNELETGFLLFMATLTAFFSTQVAGSAIDRGRLKTIYMLASLLLAAGIALLLTHRLSAAIVGLNLLVLATRCLETGFKVTLSDRARREIVEMAHNTRYYYVNIGGALAPTIVALTGLHNRVFLLYGCLILALLIGLYTLFYGSGIRQSAAKKNLFASLAAIRQDKTFLQLCLFSILFYMVMASNDTVLLMLLSQHFSQKDALHYYASIQVVNTLMVLLLYFPINHFMLRFDLRARVFIALGIIISSQMMIYFNLLQNGYLMVIFALIFTSGEIIAISSSNYALELLTPDEHKGAYFSFYNIYMTGMALAPLVGGAFLKLGVGDSYYLFMSVILLIASFIFNLIFTAGRFSLQTESR
ncbi:MFS transporter [Erwinia piriflorinigrans]|uniref:Putative MFS-type transporter yqjV n=1 Tax=Erwinia piriflorinigrans CFBP 5888 TaxID=1161919 RepID=V5ZAW9_9GAMM|nr:MFS transporter [Erwinia piriflorinigrans]CCG88056.1 putative MFS-type transporter yqjV [Erwinia piriflorinigrans CFBP 5888]